MDTKTITLILGLAAVLGVGYLVITMRRAGIVAAGPPGLLPAPSKAEARANLAQNDLARLQVLKGSKAIAEASKEAQLGEVRAHDRAATKAKVAA